MSTLIAWVALYFLHRSHAYICVVMSLRERTRPGLRITIRAVISVIVAAGTSTGCSSFSKPQQTAAPDPNVFPANYRSTLLAFLRQSLTDQPGFHGAMISEPALKPVGPSQHYVVCVQFNPRGQTKTTQAAVFLSGQMTQFIDATPEQCADAVYQPFKELEAADPSATTRQDMLSDPRGMN